MSGWIIIAIPRPPFLNLLFHEPFPIAAEEVVSKYGGLKDRNAIYSGTIDNTDRAIKRVIEKLDAMGVRETL